uniref:Mitochondrial basic amino acids transporter n=1 Tax=Acrobeloides nanus TaxID=290746 RepID=A0A914DIR9_9BILA
MSISPIDFVAGCFGGAAGVLAGHPLDTIKVRLQTTSGVYRGTWHCFSTIFKNEGARGLYKGMSSPLASLAVVNAVVFGVHGNVTKQFENKDALMTHFIAGCSAGAAQAFIAGPTELLKLRVQIQTDSAAAKYKSPFDCLKTVIKEQGIRTLGRGMLSTLLRDIPAFGTYFASYEIFGEAMSKDGKMESLTSWQLLLAGGGAGMASWIFTYPTDVIKTRFQADDSYRSYMEVIKSLHAEKGLRGFFVGLGPTMLRAFPSNAATFFVVDWTYRMHRNFQMPKFNIDVKFQPEPRAQRPYLIHVDFCPGLFLRNIHGLDKPMAEDKHKLQLYRAPVGDFEALRQWKEIQQQERAIPSTSGRIESITSGYSKGPCGVDAPKNEAVIKAKEYPTKY